MGAAFLVTRSADSRPGQLSTTIGTSLGKMRVQVIFCKVGMSVTMFLCMICHQWFDGWWRNVCDGCAITDDGKQLLEDKALLEHIMQQRFFEAFMRNSLFATEVVNS